MDTVRGVIVVCAGALIAVACSSPAGRSTKIGSAGITRPESASSRPSPPTSASELRGPEGSGQPVTFAFAGDTQFVDTMDTEAGAVSTGTPLLSQRVKADPTGVLAPVAPVLSAADLAMVNLETAITERGEPVAGKNFHFRSPAASFTALKAAGVDVVNMANNHSLDYGPIGMADTFDAIGASGFPVVGIGHDAAEAYRPYRTVIRGQRIAVFGALDWLEPALIPAWSATETQPGVAFAIDRPRLLAAVRAVRPEVDTLVVFLHWGTEQTHCASDEQQDLAQSLIASGVDVIVGSHAHRVFGAGRTGTSFVAFGLGNFTYWREDGESGRSGVLQVTATGAASTPTPGCRPVSPGGSPCPTPGATQPRPCPSGRRAGFVVACRRRSGQWVVLRTALGQDGEAFGDAASRSASLQEMRSYSSR